MDFDTCLGVVRRLDDVERLLDERGNGAAVKNPKSILKEYCEKHRIRYRYEITAAEGPDHRQTFVCRLTVEGYSPTEGTGRSLQKAQMAAAEQMLAVLAANA